MTYQGRYRAARAAKNTLYNGGPSDDDDDGGEGDYGDDDDDDHIHQSNLSPHEREVNVVDAHDDDSYLLAPSSKRSNGG